MFDPCLALSTHPRPEADGLVCYEWQGPRLTDVDVGDTSDGAVVFCNTKAGGVLVWLAVKSMCKCTDDGSFHSDVWKTAHTSWYALAQEVAALRQMGRLPVVSYAESAFGVYPLWPDFTRASPVASTVVRPDTLRFKMWSRTEVDDVELAGQTVMTAATRKCTLPLGSPAPHPLAVMRALSKNACTFYPDERDHTTPVAEPAVRVALHSHNDAEGLLFLDVAIGLYALRHAPVPNLPQKIMSNAFRNKIEAVHGAGLWMSLEWLCSPGPYNRTVIAHMWSRHLLETARRFVDAGGLAPHLRTVYLHSLPGTQGGVVKETVTDLSYMSPCLQRAFEALSVAAVDTTRYFVSTAVRRITDAEPQQESVLLAAIEHAVGQNKGVPSPKKRTRRRQSVTIFKEGYGPGQYGACSNCATLQFAGLDKPACPFNGDIERCHASCNPQSTQPAPATPSAMSIFTLRRKHAAKAQ